MTNMAQAIKPLEVYPHVALAMATSSTGATWGSSLSDSAGSTYAPGDIDLDDLESTFSFDDDFVIGPAAHAEELEDVDPAPADTGNEDEQAVTDGVEAAVQEAAGDDAAAADDDDLRPRPHPRRRRQRKKHAGSVTARLVVQRTCPHLLVVDAVNAVHMEDAMQDALQQIAATEPGKPSCLPRM